MLQIILLLLVIMAVMALQTEKLRNAIIYLGVFSLVISFAYIMYNAPDVAIAEAVIGSAFSTILFFTAFKKYKAYHIYYYFDDKKNISRKEKTDAINMIKRILEKFCVIEELEAHIIHTGENSEEIIKKRDYELIIDAHPSRMKIYGKHENYKFDVLKKYLKSVNTETLWEIIEIDKDIPWKE